VRRRIIRERVVQALYAFEMGGESVETCRGDILTGLKNNPAAYEFCPEGLSSRPSPISRTSTTSIRDKGEQATGNFKRIAVLDRLILRMGICALRYFKEIPPKVSMNEAIELAKLSARSGADNSSTAYSMPS